AREDHEGHAHRDDDQKGVVDQQVEEHLRREEAGVEHRTHGGHGHEQRDGGDQWQVLDVQARRRCLCGWLRRHRFEVARRLWYCAHDLPPVGSGRRTRAPTWERNSLDCSSTTTNTTTALTTRLI